MTDKQTIFVGLRSGQLYDANHQPLRTNKMRQLMIEKLLNWYRNEIRWMNDLPTTRDQVEYHVTSYKEQLERLDDENLLALYTKEIKLV